jgi:hypothetical protein
MFTIVEFNPFDLVGLEVAEGFDVETGESRVKGGERYGIGTVQSDELVSGSHVGHLILLLRDIGSG